MTITVTIRVPHHCAASVTTIANPTSDNPTETTQTYDPGSTTNLVVYDGQSLRIDEIAAPAQETPHDALAADQSGGDPEGRIPSSPAERDAADEEDFDDLD